MRKVAKVKRSKSNVKKIRIRIITSLSRIIANSQALNDSEDANSSYKGLFSLRGWK